MCFDRSQVDIDENRCVSESAIEITTIQHKYKEDL